MQSLWRGLGHAKYKDFLGKEIFERNGFLNKAVLDRKGFLHKAILEVNSCFFSKSKGRRVLALRGRGVMTPCRIILVVRVT